jgi:hypothetical protein
VKFILHYDTLGTDEIPRSIPHRKYPLTPIRYLVGACKFRKIPQQKYIDPLPNNLSEKTYSLKS